MRQRSWGLGIAGFDLLRSRRGPLVLVVNASPGLEGIEHASEKDVAGEIIAHIEQAVVYRKLRAKPAA